MLRFKNRGGECSIIEDGKVYDFDIQGNLSGQGRQATGSDMTGMVCMPIISIINNSGFYYGVDEKYGVFNTKLNPMQFTTKIIASSKMVRSLMVNSKTNGVAFSQMIFVLSPDVDLKGLICSVESVG